jgi:AAA+ ATPase superfamily predicted ATPase
MDLVLPIFFFVFAFFCMLFALYEERDTNIVEEDEEVKSDNLIVILLGASVVLFFISTACMYSVSGSYYSSVTDTLVTYYMPEYQPLGWLGIGFAMFNLILVGQKSLDMLGKHWKNSP